MREKRKKGLLRGRKENPNESLLLGGKEYLKDEEGMSAQGDNVRHPFVTLVFKEESEREEERVMAEAEAEAGEEEKRWAHL